MGNKVILVSGYPGAGKSTVGDILEEKIPNAKHIESGTIVREKYKEETGNSNIESHKLGEWIDSKVEENETYVADLTLKKAKSLGSEKVVISGLRELEAHKIAEKKFKKYDSIFVDASFKTRLDRMKNRGREGEENFDKQDLRERDEREINWGIEEIREYSKKEIENNGSLESLKNKISQLNLFN